MTSTTFVPSPQLNTLPWPMGAAQPPRTFDASRLTVRNVAQQPQFQQGIGWAATVSPRAFNTFTNTRPQSHLPDPITAKEKNIALVPMDRILNYNAMDNLGLNLQTAFVTLPKTIWRGLRGDPGFNFADYMLITKVPYYLGGVFLALAPLVAKSKASAARMAVAVVTYFGGNQLAHTFINKLYRSLFGVPLDLKYRGADERVQDALISVDFPRIDLLTEAHYREMREKMGIPDNVADPRQACNQEIQRLILSSRAMKVLLGNVLAAVGAGYIAQTDAWSALSGRRVADGFRTLFQTTVDNKVGGPLQRADALLRTVGAWMKPALSLKLKGGPGVPNAPRFLAGLAVVGTFLFTLLHSLSLIKPKKYEAAPVGLRPRLNDSVQPSIEGAESVGAFLA